MICRGAVATRKSRETLSRGGSPAKRDRGVATGGGQFSRMFSAIYAAGGHSRNADFTIIAAQRCTANWICREATATRKSSESFPLWGYPPPSEPFEPRLLRGPKGPAPFGADAPPLPKGKRVTGFSVAQGLPTNPVPLPPRKRGNNKWGREPSEPGPLRGLKPNIPLQKIMPAL